MISVTGRAESTVTGSLSWAGTAAGGETGFCGAANPVVNMLAAHKISISMSDKRFKDASFKLDFE